MTQHRVVHVTSAHVWSDTRIFQRMCQGLSKQGWRVSLIASNVPSQVVEGVRVQGVRVPKSRVLRALVGGFRTVVAARAIGADIYHFHDPELLIWKWLLALGGRLVVYDMHEYVPGAITTRVWIPPSVRRVLARCWGVLERITLRHTPVILAEHSYVKYYPWLQRKAVVLNLPDVETLLSIPLKAHGRRIIYVGRVSRTRGSVRMIEALELLRARGVEVELDIVGPMSDAHRTELIEAIGRAQLPNVRLHGYMKPVDAWRLAAGAAAGLAVLEPEPNYVESFPTKMFEYMALGLPVVVSDFPLYSEVVDRNACGVCVNPLDSAALAAALERLLGDPAKARVLGRNGREAVQKLYRWDQQLAVLEAFYRDNLAAREPATR
jgi:glycosyltransferase involved in cell wall biosynthesis